LTEDEIVEVTRLQLDRVKKMLAAQGFEFNVSEGALRWLAKMGFDPIYGARPIKRAIQTHLVNKLAEMLLAGKLDKEKPILINAGDEGLEFSVN
jgi:ATP-dependent Clp protease ATP-binding subunit ClpB